MFPVGGVGVMLLGAAASALICLLFAILTRRWLGVLAWLLAALIASLAVIGLVTLIPANGAPGIVSAEGRLTSCSWDIGGPAPEGFWIFSSGQRLLNTVLFIPSGVLVVLVAAAASARFRWLRGAPWWATPIGLALLVGYSVGIEYTQLQLARLDRACDVTDVVDNSTGAVVGVALAVVLISLRAGWRRLVRR